jgi:IS5 family transposase
MLRLGDGQVECLWDDVLPEEARALPEDLAALDVLLRDPAVLRPIGSHWQQQDEAVGRSAASRGRPTISMQTYVRLMVVKHRTGWGYETLMREVADSFHLRRFCLIALGERVPDESTVRKLTRKLGAGVVNQITRLVIDKARREKRFRPRAARIDSTVVEADVRYPTDSGLALDSARVLAREARKLLVKVGRDAGHVRDRSRAIGRRVRAMTRTLGRRTGERKQQVLELTEQAGKLVERSIREAKRLIVIARRRARGRGARAKLRQIERLQQFIELADRVTEQIRKRMRGERITDRLEGVSSSV